MLFNLFGKKEENEAESIFTDRCYMSTNAKLRACAKAAQENRAIFFVCWFPKTLELFKDFFAGQGISEERVKLAREINDSMLHHKAFSFAEHYPLHGKELELVKNWPQKKIIVYSAMDEPLFKHLGSDKMLPLMKLLGMKEDEAIEHSFVTKSIIKGQAKIAAAVPLEQAANSQEEWMERNYKPSA